jgi:DNA-binding MarR family transcriptional regulator
MSTLVERAVSFPAMETEELVTLFERIVMGAVGITTRALAEAAPGVELTFPQWRALVILGESETGARVSEVAARVSVTVPATSRLLRRLQARGFLTLGPDERDARAVRARLTPVGQDVRDRIFNYRCDVLRTMIGEIDEADRETLPGAMELLAEPLWRFA